MTLSGRGDKDVQEVRRRARWRRLTLQILDVLPKWSDRLDWHIAQ